MEKSAKNGIFATGLDKILLQVIGFVQGVILARLLKPSDFGLAAMLGIFLGVGASLAESGLGVAYVGNVVAFLKWNIECNKAPYSFYNYIDKPDFNMNDLVCSFEKALGKKLPPIRLPYWFGLVGGYCFDLLALITRGNCKTSQMRGFVIGESVGGWREWRNTPCKERKHG